MKLYLVQHGEACTKEVNPERPLTEQGKTDVDCMASFLYNACIRVERIIHSGKLRARQTAERLAFKMAPEIELETSNLINPNDDPAAFDWQSASWDHDTLIVGHQPFMSKFVSHLLFNSEVMVFAYKPGSVVCLERTEEGRWVMNWMLRPELV